MNDQDIINRALEILEERTKYIEAYTITCPDDVKDLVKLKYGELEHEVFAVIFMDNRHRVIAHEIMFRGTIDGTSVHAREVVKAALHHNAAAVILVHNHPSGIPEPSQADQRITERLTDALKLVDVRVLDHIIVGNSDTVSFAERGLL